MRPGYNEIQAAYDGLARLLTNLPPDERDEIKENGLFGAMFPPDVMAMFNACPGASNSEIAYRVYRFRQAISPHLAWRPLGMKVGSRWLPSVLERQVCCESIPCRLYKHCCTLEHISTMLHVDPTITRSWRERVSDKRAWWCKYVGLVYRIELEKAGVPDEMALDFAASAIVGFQRQPIENLRMFCRKPGLFHRSVRHRHPALAAEIDVTLRLSTPEV